MNDLQKIKELSNKIKGLVPLSELVPDLIDHKKELELIKRYLNEFRKSDSMDLTAANYYQFCYGFLLTEASE